MEFEFDCFTIIVQPASSELVGLHNKINFWFRFGWDWIFQTCFLQDCDVKTFYMQEEKLMSFLLRDFVMNDWSMFWTAVQMLCLDRNPFFFWLPRVVDKTLTIKIKIISTINIKIESCLAITQLTFCTKSQLSFWFVKVIKYHKKREINKEIKK